MSFSPSLVYDFIFLAVFSFAAVKSWQKGFLAGLTELIGAVLGVGIAFWGSRTLAPEVYLSFFSDSVSTRVEQAVAQSGGDIAAAVQGLDFLPESIRAALAAGLQTAGNQLPEKNQRPAGAAFPAAGAGVAVCAALHDRALGVRPAGAAAARRQPLSRWWAVPTGCWVWCWAL